MEKYKNQKTYYWRHRDEILKKNAEKRKDPKEIEKRRKIALKSYYKRKEKKNAATENKVR